MTDVSHPRSVDFHCHLDLYPDHERAVAQRERECIFTLAVTTTPRAWPRNYELAKDTRHVRAALGLHPQLVADHAHELSLWKELLPRARYVGEVGLDAGPRFYKSFDKQKSVFEEILKACATERDKILSIHSVRATKTVLDMIEANLPPERGRVVLHWFTGTPSEARRAIDMGCYFSINASMLTSEKRVQLVRSLPAERILTETDGPFTEKSAQLLHPSNVDTVLSGLAKIHEKSFISVSRKIENNLKELLADG
ncbi:TatD family hydrolase [Thalassospiraceae bacterium SW-3-3]|nr:TatD family hydrolase [Thalassospiraceae bacterium SW-3-3]